MVTKTARRKPALSLKGLADSQVPNPGGAEDWNAAYPPHIPNRETIEELNAPPHPDDKSYVSVKELLDDLVCGK